MAYTKEGILKQCLDVIGADEHIINIEDIIINVPFHKATFYRYITIDSDEYDTIKKALDNNRVKIKQSLRKDWKKSKQAVLQLALYKLCGTEEELKRISSSNIDISTKGESINKKQDLSKLSKEELQTMIAIQKKINAE